MTKEERQQRIDTIKIENTVPEILHQYGVEVKRGRCKAICHAGTHYTAKVSRDIYFCFKCDVTMDVFDLTMHFNNCDFNTAFELLGGSEKPSFTATVKARQAKREREQRIAKERKLRLEIKRNQRLITAYRNIIAESEPLSDLWCYCQNQLQLHLYKLEFITEKR